MRRHRQVSEAALPWVGGWWIGRGESGALPAPQFDGTTLRGSGYRACELALEWRVHSADAEDAPLALLRQPAGSAT